MDFEAIKAAAQGYQADMTRFLREMISHPSESCEEKEVVHCIKAETASSCPGREKSYFSIASSGKRHRYKPLSDKTAS